MIEQNEGLTATYGRFDTPMDVSQSIRELRRLHAVLDRTVLDAYGWHDISEQRSFETEWSEEDGKEFIRFTWPQEVHDEVLVRLLTLNAERHGEETRGLIRSLLAEDRAAFAHETALDKVDNERSTAEVV